MKRPLIAAVLFALGVSAALSGDAPGQPPAAKKQPPGKFDPPKLAKPDDATLKQIADKTEQLGNVVAALRASKGVPDDVLAEVEVYLKAAENIVRFDEWYHANSGRWALATLDQGLERAKEAAAGKAPWRDAAGRWVVRAYRSKVDGSVQPYAVLLPHDFGKDLSKKWRLDVVLHGRDPSLTEAKFIATHDGSKPASKDLGYVQLEVYGRGNNAYRWAGETDVFEAMEDFVRSGSRLMPRGGEPPGKADPGLVIVPAVDGRRVVLRGFSMGGAGTWHIGLHHPDRFCVIGPGAGFTTTRGYVGSLPPQLPDYQEKCLHIYDAADYAENAFNVPVVAYSGEKDVQKAAADNIERRLKGFKEPVRFTHLVAPGLDHKMPPEWQEKAEAEYRKYADKGRPLLPDRVRFVTHTPRYGSCGGVWIDALERTYEKAVIDVTQGEVRVTVATANVRRFGHLLLWPSADKGEKLIYTIDGQRVEVSGATHGLEAIFEKAGGKWAVAESGKVWARLGAKPEKRAFLQGPIDDAFADAFLVVKPTAAGFSPGNDRHAAAAVDQFAGVWDRYFRGPLPLAGPDGKPVVPPVPRPVILTLGGPRERAEPSLVLFGDPASNPLLGRVAEKLPVKWTKDELVVNGEKYDPKTHTLAMIYPNPLNGNRGYVVLNTGHTFTEADLRGTNALLYPRLGDWAVIRPAPTDKDPAAYEVVAAGLFDEDWQFPKK